LLKKGPGFGLETMPFIHSRGERGKHPSSDLPKEAAHKGGGDTSHAAAGCSLDPANHERVGPDRSGFWLRQEGAEAAWNSASWREAAREYHQARAGRPAVVELHSERLAHLRRLMADDVSLERAWAQLNACGARPTPQSTIEAVIYTVRERGVAALKERTNIERLARCDAAARAEINRRIARLVAAKEIAT
jgi:hypothetical protein